MTALCYDDIALADRLREIIDRKKLDLRAIAFDLDGTLLDPYHRLPAEVAAAVKTLKGSALRTVLASGRPIRSVLEMAALLDVSGPVVAANGAFVADSTHIQFSYSLEPEHVSVVLDQCEVSPDLSWSIYDRYSWTVAALDDNVRTEAAILGFLPDQVCAGGRPVTAEKILVIGPDPSLSILCERLSAYGECVAWVRGKASYLEIVRRGGHKALGLTELGRGLGLSLEHFIAVGDSDNDVEMLQEAGLSIAMGNSSSAALEAADLVIGTNAECAVIQLIEALHRIMPGRFTGL